AQRLSGLCCLRKRRSRLTVALEPPAYRATIPGPSLVEDPRAAASARRAQTAIPALCLADWVSLLRWLNLRRLRRQGFHLASLQLMEKSRNGIDPLPGKACHYRKPISQSSTAIHPRHAA